MVLGAALQIGCSTPDVIPHKSKTGNPGSAHRPDLHNTLLLGHEAHRFQELFQRVESSGLQQRCQGRRSFLLLVVNRSVRNPSALHLLTSGGDRYDSRRPLSTVMVTVKTTACGLGSWLMADDSWCFQSALRAFIGNH